MTEAVRAQLHLPQRPSAVDGQTEAGKAWGAVAAQAARIGREASSTQRYDNLAAMVPRFMVALKQLVSVGDGKAIGTLSYREREILTAMSHGKSNKDIGVDLWVTEDTVKTHARWIFRKLDARCRAHAVAEGLRRGIIV